MGEETGQEPGMVRRRIGGRMVEITRASGRGRVTVVIDDGDPISGRIRSRIIDDDLVVYEVVARGIRAVPISVDDQEALTRAANTRPRCAGCGGTLSKHGLAGMDLGEAGRYCFDCT